MQRFPSFCVTPALITEEGADSKSFNKKIQPISQKSPITDLNKILKEATTHFKRKYGTIIKSPSQNAYAKKI